MFFFVARGRGGAVWPYLHIAVVVAGVAAEAGVDEHAVQIVDQRIPMGLGHVGTHVKVLRIPHVLCMDEAFHELLFEVIRGTVEWYKAEEKDTDLCDLAAIVVGKSLE